MIDHINSGNAASNFPYGQSHNSIHSLQHQPNHRQHPPTASRLEALYERHLDDRNFVPDGMVPGLRSVMPTRSRESSMFSDLIADGMQVNLQRHPHQQRGLDQMYSGPFYQQTNTGRHTGIPLQHTPYRGGPSPISGQNLPPGLSKGLPPGLANLGGRPPHEPSQFLGMPVMPPSGMLHPNGNSQPFNSFVSPVGASHGYGVPQMRVSPPGPHQLQNSLALNQMAGLGHPGNVDLRGPNQAHLLGMGGMRGTGGFSTQQGASVQMQTPLAARQPHLTSHLMPQHLAPPLQQQPLSRSNNQPAHDLMALLMGNPNRE
jgi:zinc finger CCCH domain-containing protein 13